MTEFCDDFSRPSGVLGPWDLAPLAREVADFKSDVILALLIRAYTRELESQGFKCVMLLVINDM